jgi:hypothetical protein
MRRSPFPSLAIILAFLILAPLAHAQQIAVTLVSLTSAVSPGGTAMLTVQTLPGARCLITVRYKSGPSKAAGLAPKTADGKGRARWTWRVGTRTTPGKWPIFVTCSSGEQEASLGTLLVVR